MEWNSECTKLQLSHVTGTAQSRLKYSRAVISPQRLYEQVCNIAQMFLHISKHDTVASLSSVIIVVLQSQTKVRVWLRKTTVMELSSRTKI